MSDQQVGQLLRPNHVVLAAHLFQGLLVGEPVRKQRKQFSRLQLHRAFRKFLGDVVEQLGMLVDSSDDVVKVVTQFGHIYTEPYQLFILS